jgi:hypothetical protein
MTREKRIEELAKLREDTSVVDDDPRVLHLQREIIRLGEVADSSSVWTMWLEKRRAAVAQQEEAKKAQE